MLMHFMHLTARVRECWVMRRNRRLSAPKSNWTDESLIHALAVESIDVDKAFRRQGECRAFLQLLQKDKRFEMLVIEAVGNQILAEALMRWGWEYDHGVMDFYWMQA